MFFPKAMSEVELIVPARDMLKVTRLLSGRGVFHQRETGNSEFGRDGSGGMDWQEQAAAYSALSRRIQAAMQALNMEEQPVAPSDAPELADRGVAALVLDGIESDIAAAAESLNALRKKVEKLRTERGQLLPISDLDIDVEMLRESRYLRQILGTMPAANVQRLRTSLGRIPHVFLTLRADSHSAIVWIAGAPGNRDIMERAAKSAYLESLVLPLHYEGNPRVVLERIDAELTSSESELADAELRFRQLAAQHAPDLQRLALEVHASQALSEAIVRSGKLRNTYVMIGWVPSQDVPELSRKIRQASPAAILETMPAVRAGDRRNVPVALQSPRWLRPFQMLVTTYARPRYGEVDPTWLVALTFPLLFGAMFGDVGHGLLLAALGILLGSRKVRALHSLAGLGGLITVCGLAATGFGFLYGSIFGFEHVLHAAWLQPGEDPLTILGVAVGAGIVLLSIGFLLGILNGAISRDWGHLLFGHNGIAAALLYWSILGMAGSAAGIISVPVQTLAIVAIMGAVAIMFSTVLIRLIEGERPLIEGGLATYAIQAPMELFETVISFLSNSLSYVRVGAFAIAHVVLSSVVFLLAELVSPGQGFAYWTIVVVGNIGIVFYEGLIVGIQAMRLSYYEFFGKFFSGGGMRFEPLTLLPNRRA